MEQDALGASRDRTPAPIGGHAHVVILGAGFGGLACAEALGENRSEHACQALSAAVATTEHPKARRAVVRALGAFRGSEREADALLRVVEGGDPSLFVEAEA